MIEPRLPAAGTAPPIRARWDDEVHAPAIPARPAAEPVDRTTADAPTPGRIREQVRVLPDVVPRVVVVLAGAVLVARDAAVFVAYGVWWLRWPDWSQPLADVAQVLVDVDHLAASALWIALLVWMVVTVTNVRRVGGWRTSVVSAVLAWAIPTAVYLNPWYDMTSGFVGWVPILLLALPAAVIRTAGREVGRGQTAWLWFGVTVLWIWAAGRVAASDLLFEGSDSVDARTRVLVRTLFGGLALVSVCAWWGTMRQTMGSIARGVVDRARPIDDVSTATAFREAAALGVDPTAVLVAARSSESRPGRTGPVRLTPVAWLVAVCASCTVAVFVVGAVVLAPLVDEWTTALDASPTGEAPAPDGYWSTVATCAGLAAVAVLSWLVWGVLLGRNARRLGARDVSTGRWIIGSLVPIVQLFVPFTYLRDVSVPLGGPERAIGRWQLAVLLAFSAAFVGNIAGTRVDDGIRTILNTVTGLATFVAFTIGFVTMVLIGRHMAGVAAAIGDDPPAGQRSA